MACAAAVFLVLLIEAAAGRWIGPWGRIFENVNRLAPLLFVPALAWWGFHMYFALKAPNPELVDLRNPIAAQARALVLSSARR